MDNREILGNPENLSRGEALGLGGRRFMSCEVGAIVSIPSKRMVQGPIVFTPKPPLVLRAALKPVDLHATYHTGPLMAVDTTRAIVLQWRTHSWPLRSLRTPVAALHSVVRELGGLAGGPHTVVVLSLGAHFTTFPPSVFVQRLAGVRAAVAALLAREPDTLVVIKLANTGYKSVYGSDWFTLQVNRLLRAAFVDLRVAFVDAWEMTSSLALPDSIHPGRCVVRNEVDLLLSHVCPT